ncbi:MAG: hypothetical protein HY718_14875, partial [Planctomycetes bacterium]|nr:hypothetical protein [Planctomycetota bacterium]
MEHYAINVGRLKEPLKAIPDDVEQGGSRGHVAIAPMDGKGDVDRKLLEEWAAHREQGVQHYLTGILLDAIVEA